MDRFKRWLVLGSLAGGLALVGGCTSDSNTAQPTQDSWAPSTPGVTLLVEGTCMGDDAVNYPGNVSGFGTDPNAFNCTANDIRIANARTESGAPIRCVEGETISPLIVADVIETATSVRSDIGIWIAEDGGNAETGMCEHFYFSGPPFTPPVASLDDPGDGCGDLASADTVNAFPLSSLNLTCSDPDGDGLLEVASCVSWTQPGGDRICPADPGGARAGTLPANKSKCNCEPFYIEIEILPELTLEKTVVNDNGGDLVDTDWTLTATGPETITGTEGDEAITSAGVEPGSYTLSEDGHPGYAQDGDWVCVDNATTEAFPVTGGNQVTLASGDKVTCTVTNNDIQPQLTVIKHVINDDGGSATASDFTMQVTATNPDDDAFPGAESPGTTIGLDAGTYSVDEAAFPGYSKSLSADCSGTIAIGESKTCTITNDDQPATLTLVKTVANNYGGTATAADFQAYIDDDPVDWESPKELDAGSYTASEDLFTGYSAGDWGGDCASDGSVTLGVGEHKTCTITNSDIQPQLTVIKHVINDDGGSAVASAFTMQVTATNPDDDAFPGAESPGTTIGLDAGSYSVDEAAYAGYSKSLSADCSGTIAIGESKTCTITNDDQPASLIVIKHVINDDGGSAGAADFTMQVTANNPEMASFPGAESPGTTISVDPGTYSVEEAAYTGYSKSLSADCSGTIALGETKTCTITNDDVRPQLTVIKHMINDDGGTAGADDFTMQVTATNPDNASFPGAESPGTTIGLNAGSYSVDEAAYDGYSKSLSADCSGTIAVGGSKTCTITNDDDAPHLTLLKDVLNGDALDTDFTLTATGPVTISGVEGDASVTDKAVMVGTYTLSESSLTGYEQVGDWSCTGGTFTAPDQIALDLGESATCTVTNQALVQITLEKYVAGSPSTMTWNFSLNGPGVSENVSLTSFTDFNGAYLQVGEEYTLCEAGLPAGWDANWTLGGSAVTPYNPDASNEPPEDLGNRCYDFTPTVAGATVEFVVDNLPPPGGEPRTIGYWKNWSTCTPGGQVANAERNGGAAVGFFLLDDVLPIELSSDPEALADGFMVSDCETGVAILDKRSIDDGKKRANDAAYGMAAQLLAAMANTSPLVNASCRPPELATWIMDARQLLFTLGFDGTGAYLPPQTENTEARAAALNLAAWLDNYNNGMYCGG